MKTNKFIIIICFSLILNFLVLSTGEAKEKWTRSEILKIADKKAIELGFNVDELSVSFDIYNTQWREYLDSANNFIPFPELQEKLKEINYLAIHYAQFKEVLGGDLWVFINLDNEEIIQVIEGQ